MSKPNMYCGECPYWLAYGEPETTDEQKLAIEKHCAKCAFDFDPVGVEHLDKMMRAARQQIVLRKAIHEEEMIMPFGIPSEDFHGGFGIPEDEVCVINYDDTDGEAEQDDYDPYTGKYAFVSPDDDLTNEEYESAAGEAHDNLVRSLVEAGGEIREARELLTRSLAMLYLIGYDSSFTNSAIDTLTNDIKKFLEDTE